MAALVLVVAIFVARHLLFQRRPVRHAHLRGRRLSDTENVAAIVGRTRSGNDPGLLIGRHLFPSHVATNHFAFVGTTGSGKTLLQRLLMQSALTTVGHGHGHRAVVYDAKQDTLSILSGMRIGCPVHVLNPLDARSVAWDMAADVESPAVAPSKSLPP
ncbi:MAG: type IV secretion system DNA-binding domain-containing protein [Verrucomicrobiales bacterium]|nr:type IV secretion system DNA-binding domain-containing protein [Verrucomicrobiales bacterium]